MAGISNFQIEEAFESIGDEDLLENFVGVFPLNRMNRFRRHWWSILDIEPRNDIFFFDSFGIEGLRHYIIQDDKKTVEKILLGIEQMDRSDKKITLCKIKFNMGAYKQLSQEEIESLSETARNLFYFINAFGIK